MILDALENHGMYSSISSSVAKAFQFLTETNLQTIALGTHKIDGDHVFAIVMNYKTKAKEACIIEAHYKYIDVHYIISGGEMMGHATLRDQVPIEANKEKDYAFYNCKTNDIPLTEGNFAVLYPHDIHQTGVQINQPAMLKKVVVKVSVQ